MSLLLMRNWFPILATQNGPPLRALVAAIPQLVPSPSPTARVPRFAPTMSFTGSRPPTAIIKKSVNGQVAADDRTFQTNGFVGNNALQVDKPLNVLVSIDEDVLIEQQQLEAPLRPGPRPVGPTLPTTLWITNTSIFKGLKKQLVKLIGAQRFTIYPITRDEIKCKPWQATTALLLLVINPRKYKDEDDFLVDADIVVKEYINNGGLAVVYKLSDLWENDLYIEDNLRTNFFKERLIAKCGKAFFAASGRVIKFEDDVEKDLLPKVTPAYLLSSDDTDSHDFFSPEFVKETNRNANSKVYFLQRKGTDLREEEEDDDEDRGSPYSRLPVIIGSQIPSNLSFDHETYFSNLTSSRLGHHILYSEVTTSTQTLIEPFTGYNGLVVIANQQTEGRGRGENQWLSPKGCAMFSAHLTVSLASKLGQRLGFVQHLAALAIIRGVLGIPGYSDLNLKLKWPNDIYWSNKMKLGGIVVSSVLRGHSVHCFIGCGINVSNSTPTSCINDEIKRMDPKREPLSNELIISRSISELDSLMKKFERQGVESIKELYLEHWIHSNQKVRIANTKQVIVEGLDDQGYLLVRDTASGLLFSVHPDGNRFDMLHNLLVRK